MKIGELVREARKRKGLTQAELAEITEMAQGSIGMLESGKVDRPMPETLRKLSQALDISMTALVAATGQLDPPPPTVDDYTQERIEAEIERIAAIPGTEAKMKELSRLFVFAPKLYDLVEQMVHDVILESTQQPVQSPSRRPANGTRDHT